MIINFLQTRKPPILPALHQRPHLKLPSNDGHESAFADDVDALRNFGKENKETLGELLCQFFRFYGHEIDYDKSVVSVRNGRLTSKVDKGWHLATNNMLCVEEPFNINRNLGNTADDTSFRGLHMELRRAFDLIAEAKLAECCEEYVFPKEEERIWEKPPPQPRPIITRSSSQSRGGARGNYRGGRHNNYTRNGNDSRRASSASSGAFDTTSSYMPPVLPPGITPQEAWMHTQAAQERLHNDLYTTFSVLQAQENNLRLQLYTQSQAYAQAQAQAYHQVQRAQTNSGVSGQQTADRHRGSSFDNPPLTAPIRPDSMYFYPLQQYQPTSVYGQHSPSAYPSSPSMSPALPELRRSLHRSTVTGSQGATGSPSGPLRSHSQPAARSVPSPVPVQGLGLSNTGMNGFPNYRQANGVIIPNFIADENMETGLENESSALADSPPDGTPKEYVGYYVNEPMLPPARKESVALPAIPAFGDIQRRRRLSTEQFPQVVLDRIRRTSRSPSPHRTYSTSMISPPFKTPSQQYTTSSNLRAFNDQWPVIVNGSGPIMTSNSGRQASISEMSLPDKPSNDGSVPPFDTASQAFIPRSNPSSEFDLLPHELSQDTKMEPRHETPLVVDSSSYRVSDREKSSPASLLTNGVIATPPPRRLTPEQAQENRVSPGKSNRAGRQSQNGAMSPLDIGPGQSEALRDDFPHLSPVYETRTPSPTANRKFEPILDNARVESKPASQTPNNESKPTLKFALANSTKGNQKQGPVVKPNGHTRASKSEGSGPGTWQTIPKNKKKGQPSDQKYTLNGGENHSEQIPGSDSERKGG